MAMLNNQMVSIVIWFIHQLITEGGHHFVGQVADGFGEKTKGFFVGESLVGVLEHVLFSHREASDYSQLAHIFQRGRLKPPTIIPSKSPVNDWLVVWDIFYFSIYWE